MKREREREREIEREREKEIERVRERDMEKKITVTCSVARQYMYNMYSELEIRISSERN